MEFALAMFGQALAIDPQYARAHAGVAECHAFLYLYAGRDPAHLLQANVASRRAIELAPDSADAHTARGVALTLGESLAGAEREFEAAIRLDPNLFDAHYAYARMCFAAGRDDQAASLWERAQVLRPDDYQSPLLVAQAYERLGRDGDATRARERGVAVAEQHLALHPDDVRALYMGANGLVALGQRDEGLAWARRALALEPNEPMLLYNIGCIYSLAGMPHDALDCLEQAVGRGLTQREWLLHDANLDSLRATPRFERLMAGLDRTSRT
jgi:tetratricopeptide (TPR) repeat protein